MLVFQLSPPLSSRHASTAFLADSPRLAVRSASNVNSRAVGLFQSLTRRFSNLDSKSPRLLIGASSVRDLSSNRDWTWQYPHADDEQIINGEVLLDSSQRHLPLVMITDTNCSFTDIVELDTFEDQNRVLTDIEKRLRRQLKTFYRPRYST